MKTIDECILEFDQLFSDGVEHGKIQHLLNQKTAETEQEACRLNYEYLGRIVALKDDIDALDDEFSDKEKLKKQLLHYCPLQWIEKFKSGEFTSSLEDFNVFKEEMYLPKIQCTVELKTWGTQEESGNGLRNIIRQKLNGDAPGHAALMITLPVNEENKVLVENYCLHENGAIKIPYSVKQYGKEFAYEIYWSFWPNKLHTLKEDIEEERSGFEITTPSDIINILPTELKERYFSPKNRKDFFNNKHTINLAPIAMPTLAPESYNQLQEQITNLKLKKYKNREDILALSTLVDNYLSDKGDFSVRANDWTEKEIKSSSNFLTLLARFKNEFANPKLIATILVQKKITKDQVISLYAEILKFGETKLKEQDQLSANLKKLRSEIYAPAVEIKNIKNQIKALRHQLACHKKLNDLCKERDDYQTYHNKEKFVTKLKEWLDSVEMDEEENKTILNRDTHEIQIDALNLKIEKLRNNLSPQVEITEKLKKSNAQLFELYQTPKKKINELYHQKLTKKEEDIHYVKLKIQEFHNKKREQENKLSQNIASCHDAIEQLEKISGDLEKSKKISIDLITQKIIELNAAIPQFDEHINKEIIYAEEIIQKLEDGLNHYDELNEQLAIEREGIEFEYTNHSNRTNEEKARFGDDPSSWSIKSKADIIELINIIKQDKINAQQGKSSKPMEFLYNRNKTVEEIAQFGNRWYPKSKDRIWQISSKQDITDLIAILQNDKRKEEIAFNTIHFSYGKTTERKKTDEEKNVYGNAIYRSRDEHSWTIKSQEDLNKLITIIKEDECKLKRNGITPFSFAYSTSKLHPKNEEENALFGKKWFPDSGELCWTIKEDTLAERMVLIMEADVKKLEEESNVIAQQMKDMKLQLNGEDLNNNRFVRGLPTRNVILHNFNIEPMLQTASQLACTTSSFNLIQENCSTTTAKILKAGAPKQMAHMFRWTENSPEHPASNAFLTNPQGIYSAANLVAKAQAGNKEAKEQVNREAFLTPNSQYYIKINQLLAFRNNRDALKSTIFSKFFSYLLILPRLLKDLWTTVDKKHVPQEELEIDKYLNKINDSIKTLKYSLIKQNNPILALQFFKEKLQEDKKGLPFFDVSSLQYIRKYIMKIESKESPTEEENILLENYYSIIKERNERISCVELAIIENKNPDHYLISRKDNSANLKWASTPSFQEALIIAKFNEEYKKIQRSKSFQFFRSDFLISIPANLSNKEKIQTIQHHIAQKPYSASAKAWENCKFKHEELELVGIKLNALPSRVNINKTTMQQATKSIRLQEKISNEHQDSQNDSLMDPKLI